MNDKILDYYNNLAPLYDKSRFGNSYGKFIDAQEKILLKKLIPKDEDRMILDLGCGTGRLLEFANHGTDISSKMIKIANNKHFSKKIVLSDSVQSSFKDSAFDLIFSFHLIMHLDLNSTKLLFEETRRILKTGGKFIFDVPSKKRRKLTNHKSKNWHGANDFNVNEIRSMLNDEWRINNYYGILFFPIHRIPTKLRKLLLQYDTKVCNSIIKEYSSYLTFVIEKI